MSKEGSEARKRREDETTQAQTRESDVRELATEEASESRTKYLETLERIPQPSLPSEASEIRALPTFEEAKAEAEAVQQGNNKAADTLSHKYGNKQVRYLRRIPLGPDGGPGWHCQAIKTDNENITVKQSQELADLLNGKIDRERMKKDAEVARSRRDRKKSRKETVTDETGTDPEAEKLNKAITEALELVPDVQDLTNLNRIVDHCGRYKLVKIEYHGKHWKVEGLEDNELSHWLAQAINSKKKAFLEQIRKNRQRIEQALQRIEYSPHLNQLDEDVWRAHQAKLIVKKFVKGLPPVNWVAEAIKGQQGSKEIADAFNKRREELIAERIKEEKERAEKQRQQEVEKLRRKIRG